MEIWIINPGSGHWTLRFPEIPSNDFSQDHSGAWQVKECEKQNLGLACKRFLCTEVLMTTQMSHMWNAWSFFMAEWNKTQWEVCELEPLGQDLCRILEHWISKLVYPAASYASSSSLTAGPITGKVKKTLASHRWKCGTGIPWKRKFLQYLESKPTFFRTGWTSKATSYSYILWFKNYGTRLFNQSIFKHANGERSSHETHGSWALVCLNCVRRNVACLEMAITSLGIHASHKSPAQRRRTVKLCRALSGSCLKKSSWGTYPACLKVRSLGLSTTHQWVQVPIPTSVCTSPLRHSSILRAALFAALPWGCVALEWANGATRNNWELIKSTDFFYALLRIIYSKILRTVDNCWIWIETFSVVSPTSLQQIGKPN